MANDAIKRMERNLIEARNAGRTVLSEDTNTIATSGGQTAATRSSAPDIVPYPVVLAEVGKALDAGASTTAVRKSLHHLYDYANEMPAHRAVGQYLNHLNDFGSVSHRAGLAELRKEVASVDRHDSAYISFCKQVAVFVDAVSLSKMTQSQGKRTYPTPTDEQVQMLRTVAQQKGMSDAQVVAAVLDGFHELIVAEQKANSLVRHLGRLQTDLTGPITFEEPWPVHQEQAPELIAALRSVGSGATTEQIDGLFGNLGNVRVESIKVDKHQSGEVLGATVRASSSHGNMAERGYDFDKLAARSYGVAIPVPRESLPEQVSESHYQEWLQADKHYRAVMTLLTSVAPLDGLRADFMRAKPGQAVDLALPANGVWDLSGIDRNLRTDYEGPGASYRALNPLVTQKTSAGVVLQPGRSTPFVELHDIPGHQGTLRADVSHELSGTSLVAVNLSLANPFPTPQARRTAFVAAMAKVYQIVTPYEAQVNALLKANKAMDEACQAYEAGKPVSVRLPVFARRGGR